MLCTAWTMKNETVWCLCWSPHMTSTNIDSQIPLPASFCLFEPAVLEKNPDCKKNTAKQSLGFMRGAYSARPNRLAPCYLPAAGVSDRHGRTATRHLGLLTTNALPAEDTDHLIIAQGRKKKRASGPAYGCLVGGHISCRTAPRRASLWKRPGARPDPTPGSKKTRPKRARIVRQIRPPDQAFTIKKLKESRQASSFWARQASSF